MVRVAGELTLQAVLRAIAAAETRGVAATNIRLAEMTGSAVDAISDLLARPLHQRYVYYFNSPHETSLPAPGWTLTEEGRRFLETT